VTPRGGDSRARRAVAIGVLSAALVGCGSTSPSPDGAGGMAGVAGARATGGGVGSSGTPASGGTGGTGGVAGSGGTAGAAGASGTAGSTGTGSQPIGYPCVNTGMCSQADGPAVCCLQILTCVLESQCQTGGSYVSCATQPCARSGWVCCDQGGMQFCTKQSACGP